MEGGIQITWGKLATAAVVIGGIIFGVGQFLFGGLKGDVGDTRADMRQLRDQWETLSSEDRTIRDIVSGAEKELREKIYETNLTVKENHVLISAMKDDIAVIKDDVRATREDIAELKKGGYWSDR